MESEVWTLSELSKALVGGVLEKHVAPFYEKHIDFETYTRANENGQNVVFMFNVQIFIAF
jgi:hypothetical protein